MDFKIELIPLAVADVDRAKDFYARIGWEAEHDHRVTEDLRFVQITPPGSACSFCFGTGLGMMPDGGRQYIQVVVADAAAAHAHLAERGIECSEVQELQWGKFVNFTDPDGNQWALQELTPYL